MLEFARALAVEAGRMLLAGYEDVSARSVDYKGRRDLVTDVDRRVETMLGERLQAACPDDAILGEEGVRRSGRSGCVWIIDPLDGTTNFVHGHPLFCTSIARARGFRPGAACFGEGKGEGEAAPATDPLASGFFAPGPPPEIEVGVIVAPVLRETYRAQRGEGAWLGERRLHVSATERLEQALVATGFAYRRNELTNANLESFRRLALRARGIRRGGAAALDLAYTAAGRLDAYWEPYLKPWDVAAGILLVTEAGGRVTDFGGQARALDGVEVLATNGRLHDPVRRLLERADASWAPSERRRLREERPQRDE